MNRQLNEVIIPNPKLRLLFIFMISNGKREMNSTIYPVPKNDSMEARSGQN